MKQANYLFFIVLVLLLLCPVFPASAAVRGADLSGYWDLNFGDKSGWMIINEHPRGGFWGGELHIYSVKKYHNNSVADWDVPMAALTGNIGETTTLIQDLQGNGGGSHIATCKIYSNVMMSCNLYLPQYPTMYGDGRDNWYWNGRTAFSARKR